MTAPENFVSRWARLKRNSGAQRITERIVDPHAPTAAEVSGESTEVAVEPVESVTAVDEPFDVASLPSIEAITLDTDIRGFLQSSVPTELTRAALRRAWSSDPAIRDFIGIAENQWDFNAPGGIDGFGPMREADNVPALLAQVFGERENRAELVPETSVSAVESPLILADREEVDTDQSGQQTFDNSPIIDADVRNPRDGGSGEEASSASGRLEGDDPPSNRRSHGGALPQ